MAPTNDAASTSTQDGEDEVPQILVRTYRPTDRDHVDFMFYSTYFSLVPEGVKQKLMAPATWVIAVGVYAYLMAIVPVLLAGLDVPSWSSLALKIFLTVAWTLVGFSALFVYTDRFELVDRIEHVRQNDLSDPEIYYLNYEKYERIVDDNDGEKEQETPSSSSSDNKENNKKKKKRVTFDKDAKPATELVRQLKPEKDRTNSHFWVVTLNNTPVGMVGLASYKTTVYDKRIPMAPAWKRLGQFLCDRYNLPVPALFDTTYQEPRVFAAPDDEKMATLQRLAVKLEFQQCGLGAILITRALNWANEHHIETVLAVTNEFQGTAAMILRDKFGFKRIKKERKGWFGQYEIHWACNVQEWIQSHQQQLQQQ